MKYSSTITLEIPGFEGVSVMMNRPSNGRRERFYLDNPDLLAKERDIARRIMAAMHGLNPAKDAEWPTEKRQEIADLLVEQQEFQVFHWGRAWIRLAVREIRGLEIDGDAATIETLISDGPEEIVNAVHDMVQTHWKLRAEPEKNLPLPSTLNVLVDGEANAGIAPHVNGQDFTSQSATAVSTPQSV